MNREYPFILHLHNILVLGSTPIKILNNSLKLFLKSQISWVLGKVFCNPHLSGGGWAVKIQLWYVLWGDMGLGQYQQRNENVPVLQSVCTQTSETLLLNRFSLLFCNRRGACWHQQEISCGMKTASIFLILWLNKHRTLCPFFFFFLAIRDNIAI